MAENVYIHIPFCRRKCKYCSFISFPLLELKEQYIKALQSEINSKYKKEPLKTLYFGGGTPSLLTVEEFRDLISLFNTNKNTEITAELNPENLSAEYLKGLKNIGINRISLGCQTFDDNILLLIGRGHNSNQVRKVVQTAKDIGFKNISLDFIYGLPNQTIESFTSDLKTAVSLGIQHISLYGLKIDKGCYFFNHRPDNIPDDELQAQMYEKAIEILKECGFEHYEISNFCLPNFESRHNLNYWNNNSYYGFGVAAHGYLNGIRYSNPTTIDNYLQNPNKPKEEKLLSGQDKLEEEIFLGFRRMVGINIQEINNKFHIDFDDKYKDILKKYTQTGHLEQTQTGYKLTTSGILVSNYILSDFIDL